jgi:hypothetical protein
MMGRNRALREVKIKRLGTRGAEKTSAEPRNMAGLVSKPGKHFGHCSRARGHAMLE